MSTGLPGAGWGLNRLVFGVEAPEWRDSTSWCDARRGVMILNEIVANRPQETHDIMT